MADNKGSGEGAVGQNAEDSRLNHDDKIALKDLLEKRLTDCGWRQDIEKLIKNNLAERGGINNVTREEITAEITPTARAMVPEIIRKEMLVRVREALESPLD